MLYCLLVIKLTKGNTIRKAFCFAFPKTIPILTGFLFLGASYGIYMTSLGFSFVYPTVMSLTIFGGSLEFVTGEMLTESFAPLSVFLLALMIQARHLFYGISMLDKYKGTGKKKMYLIFGLCDESFSINCSAVIPHDIDAGWFMFFVTILNHGYWVTGAMLGGIIGSVIPFNIAGIEFVMTALLVVIFLDNWLKEENHSFSLIGVVASVACLLVFGADGFMIPTLLCILAFISLIYTRGKERDAV